MNLSVDPYRVLQVTADADVAAIRAAYRRLARRHHPDVGGSPRAMAIINDAWRVLGNPVSRLEHDRRRARAQAERERAARGNAPTPTPTATPPPERSDAPIATRPVVPAASPAARRPPGPTVLDFGRYAGRSLAELAVIDPDYLEWLARTPVGRRLQREIEGLLARRHAEGTRPGGTSLRERLGR